MSARTTVNVPNQEPIVLPGALTVDQVRAMIGSEVAGLASMDANRTANGDQVTVTFTARTGTKG